MGGRKMYKAINKKTGEMVSAFRVINDPSYIGSEKDDWIAPYPEIENWDFLRDTKNKFEVKVIFIKNHEVNRNNRIFKRSEHFRILDDEAIGSKENESIEHILSKDIIYELIVNNSLTIDNKPIKQILNIMDIDFEYRLSPSKNSKIADIIIKLKEIHPIYGNGIIIEIQFSNQNIEKTEERTYDRILEGYSVVWLWKGDFNKENELINKDLKVTCYQKAFEEYKNKSVNNFEEYMRNNFYKIDTKCKKIDDDLNYNLYRMQDSFLELNELLKNEFNKREKYIKDINEEVNKKLKNFDENTVSSIKILYTKKDEIINEIKDNGNILLNKVEDTSKNIDNQLKNIKIDSLELDIKNKATEYLKERINSFQESQILDMVKTSLPKIAYFLINEEVKKSIPGLINEYFSGNFNLPCPNCESKDTNLYRDQFICFKCKYNQKNPKLSKI
jgi:competence CoiA-like predicted nuclease